MTARASMAHSVDVKRPCSMSFSDVNISHSRTVVQNCCKDNDQIIILIIILYFQFLNSLGNIDTEGRKKIIIMFFYSIDHITRNLQSTSATQGG